MKFKFIRFDNIYNDLLSLAENKMTGEDLTIIKHILKVVKDQRSHMSVIGMNLSDDYEDRESTVNYFWSYLVESSKVVIPMIKLYQEEMDDILKLDRNSSTISNIEKDGSNIEEATKDSSLTKNNDTPDNVNVDLTTDNFLSSASRTEVDSGKRERITRSSDIVDVVYKEVDNIARVKVLGDLRGLIDNLYQNWLNLIDRALLVYYEH